jgi:hypothetical protein
MPDLISNYFPARSELSSEQIQAARLRVVNYMRRERADLDMRPNTPFGDLYLTPAAEYLAALEVAVERFQSDLDMEKVASGVIWNCDFVERFLQAFAAVPLASLPATGLVRLTFTKDQEYEIDQSIRFSFISETTSQFSLRLAHDGPLLLKPVAAPLDSRQNQFNLVQIGVDSYAVDVPVTGSMSVPVTAGLSGRSSVVVECLSAITALIDFDDGVPEDSLSKIAERTREAFHAMTLSSRNGALSWIMRQFPDVYAVSPVLAGDDEMVRDAFNPLGIHTGGMDIHVRSKHAHMLITQRVPIPFYDEQGGDPNDVFVAKVDFLHPPHRIESITWAGNAAIDLGARGTEIRVFSRSARPDVAPGLLCAFSPLEELYVSVKMPRTSGNLPLITTSIDALGQQFAYFDITYVTDPLLTTVYDHVTSEDVQPTGSRIHVRGFNLVSFSTLTIRYTRRQGTTVNLTKAREEIVQFMTSRGGPAFPYSDGPIVDSMYYAGVQQVLAIESDAKVLWTPADIFLLDGATLPTDNVEDAATEGHLPQNIFIPSSSAFQPAWADPNLGGAESLYAKIGERNTAFLMLEDAIIFKEV